MKLRRVVEVLQDFGISRVLGRCGCAFNNPSTCETGIYLSMAYIGGDKVLSSQEIDSAKVESASTLVNYIT